MYLKYIELLTRLTSMCNEYENFPIHEEWMDAK